MNRLTKYSHGAARVDSSHTISHVMGEYIGEPIDRLAAYEDSGLTPEEVQQLAKSKAEGRIVKAIVNLGDTVYIGGEELIVESVDLHITNNGTEILYRAYYDECYEHDCPSRPLADYDGSCTGNDGEILFDAADIGETVFLEPQEVSDDATD